MTTNIKKRPILFPNVFKGTLVARCFVLGYLFVAPLLVLVTKITANRNYLYLAYLGPFFLLLVAFLLARNHWKHAILTKWVLLFGGIVVIQIFNPGTSVVAGMSYFASKYSAMLMYPITILVINDTKTLKLVLWTLFWGSMISTLYSLYQEFVGYPAFEDRWAYSIGTVHGVSISLGAHRRALGLLVYSATNAVYLSLGALTSFSLFLSKTEKSWGKLIISLCLLGIGLLLTRTRGIWVGFTVGLLFVFWQVPKELGIKRLGRIKTRLALLLVVCIIGGVIAYLAATEASLSERFLVFTNLLGKGSSLLARVEWWQSIFEKYSGSLLFGNGTGSIGTGGAAVEGAAQRTVVLSDNMYINILFSLGVGGFSVFLILLGAVCGVHRRNRHRLKSVFLRLVSLVIMSGIAAYTVFFFTGDYLESFPANLYFWAGLGIISILLYLDKTMTSESEGI